MKVIACSNQTTCNRCNHYMKTCIISNYNDLSKSKLENILENMIIDVVPTTDITDTD